MSAIDLNERWLAQLAGWDVMKRARAYVEAGQVLEASWEPPILKGVVQDGTTSFRAGLRIQSERNVENLCRCRPSQERGLICGHSVAVGLKICQPAPAPTKAPLRETPGVDKATSPPTFALQRSPTGLELQVSIILPPNLNEGLARGRVMVCFEAEWGSGLRPLNTLRLDQSYQITDQDHKALATIAGWAGGALPAMVMLNAAQFAELLEVLIDHPRVTVAKRSAVQIAARPWPLHMQARLQSDGAIRLQLAGAIPALTAGWVWHDSTFSPLGIPAPYLEMMKPGLTLARENVPRFLLDEWPRLAAAGEIDADFVLEDFEVETRSGQFQLLLSGGLARLKAKLQVRYGDEIFDLNSPAAEPGGWIPDPANVRRYYGRDVSAERAALHELIRAGFERRTEGYELVGENGVLEFFARVYPRLRRNWQVTLDDRLEQSTRRNLEQIEPRVVISSSGVQWFDLAVEFKAGGEQLAPADVQRLLLSGQSSLRLANGKKALIDTEALEEFQEMLRDAEPQQSAGTYKLSNTQAGFVAGTLRDQRWRIDAPASWTERVSALTREGQVTCPPLGDLENVLRPYQKQGVGWLGFLRRSSFGGVLADEMGLGKTLQTLAHLRAVLSETGDRRPSLVVCPTSLVSNWVAEAQRYVPTLKVLALSGSERSERFAEIDQHDLIVTSYALVRRDADHYPEFDTIVLDEAQHIKNRQTQNAQAVKSIRARHRLVLTGTPLENSVLDLWSLFDFLMPGYLGSAGDFRERYEIPITRHQNAEAQERLARRVRPFILRRLKREVVPELPARLEQVCYCELNGEQQRLYQQLLQSSRQEITQAIGAQGLGRSRMIILNALLRLRQVCCDLRLLPLPEDRGQKTVDRGRRTVDRGQKTVDRGRRTVDRGQKTVDRGQKTVDGGEGTEGGPTDHGPPSTVFCPPSSGSGVVETSGKVAVFDELLEEVLDGGHRVLVFSQFVKMLTLLRRSLDEQAIPYCYLDGSTVQRGEVVARFQTTPSIPVFLISLKAGGVGLNLTGADTVIHFDPWWNPAVEAQATDRAHRLGQTRVVTSYKLISRGTIEEKILQLQERKKAVLMAALGDEEGLLGALDVNEMMSLLETG